jgi:hypothetical protein
MSDASTPEPDRKDEFPRRSLWATLPKRSVSRVLLLLAMLAAILYLRQRAGSIATCMSEAFRAPLPPSPGVRVRLSPARSPDGGGQSLP